MFAIIQSLMAESYRFWERRDKRTDGWPLARSPLTPVLMCVAYLLVIKLVGPRWMHRRPAFQLRAVLVVYNTFQVVFNGWMFCHVCHLMWLSNYNPICQPLDDSDSYVHLQSVLVGYCFYASKLVDLFDTVFFVLRKKTQQISFLHVFHHCVMPVACFLCFRFTPGGQAAVTPLFNTLVHCVMYLYYLMAAMGPRYRKLLWWKKYLTLLQMAQFVCVGLHGLPPFFVDCDFPIAYSWYCVCQSMMFFILFRNFHTKTYGKEQYVNNNKTKSMNQ